MGKINQAKEKRLRNEEYAAKFRKKAALEDQDAKRKLKLEGGRYGKWCRIKTHPAECDCVYRD